MRVLAFLILIGIAHALLAQPPISNSGQLSKFGATQPFGIDTIDLSSLNVHLDIPLLQEPGRGLALNSHITHDNVFSAAGASQYGWETALENIAGQVFYTEASSGPNRCGPGYIDWVYRDVYGTLHSFPGAEGSECVGWVSGTAIDGSGLVLTPGFTTSTITGPDGASWKVPSQNTSSPSPYVPSGGNVDANGNTVTIATTGITDTLGSTLAIQNYTEPWQNGNSPTPPPPETYTYTDTTGASREITLNYNVYSLYGLIPPSPCTNSYTNPGSFYIRLPQSVQFPNTKDYFFSYEYISGETTGRITNVSLPTGGSISYSYPTPSGISSTNDCLDNGAFALTRTTTDGTWTYTRTLSNYGNSSCGVAGTCSSYPPPIATTTVVDPAGNTTVYTFLYYEQNGWDDYSYLETSKAVYQGAAKGTPLLLQQTCYNGFAPPCANESYSNLPNASTGILTTTDDYISYNGGPSSRTTTTYEHQLYVPTEVDEYDFGATTPTRKTITAYLTLNGVQTNKPTSVTVENSSGTTLQQTTYGYDETTAVATSGVAQHAAVSGNRGNLTSMSVWRNTDGALFKTVYTNDDTGNRLTATDPLGNPPTQYSYADSWYSGSSACPVSNTNAFLTQTTDPLGHISKAAYDACTGLKRQDQGPNDIAAGRNGTITSYDSMLNRTEIQYPDGGSVSTNYGGYAVPLTVTRTTVATPNPSVVTATVEDGYGRTVLEETTSDPVSAVKTDTTYDSLGRTQSVSNPYRSTSEATYGITSFTYDALGRKIDQCQPDNTATATTTCLPTNSYQSWSYNGNTVTYKDENGNQWERTSDALGRLTQVLEPDANNSLTIETDYQYDPLSNLTRVDQYAAGPGTADAVRIFAYNSLSQLTNACNPEAIATGSTCTATGPWSATYAYDADGNLYTKTTPYPSTETNYYDALNRLYKSTHSDKTPSEQFTFDTGSTGSNSIGQLVAENLVDPVGNTLAERHYTAFDPMGRVLTEDQCSLYSGTLNNCGTPKTTLNYTYDLAGKVWTSNSGIAVNIDGTTEPIALTYAYDGAGHLKAITSNWSDSLHPGTLFQASGTSPAAYSPFGTLANAQLSIPSGSQTPAIALARAYDKRGRPASGGYSNSSDASLYSYNFTGLPNGILGHDAASNTTGINDTVMGVWSFGYDHLNRLASANGVSGTYNGAPIAGRSISWVYDPFGNRKNQTPSSGAPFPSAWANYGNNQITSSSQGAVNYDASGAVNSDGINTYTLDSEERICNFVNLVSKQAYTNIYDAGGHRVAKGTVNAGKTCFAAGNGFQATETTILGQDGEQITATGPSNAWLHTNVYANGELLATYNGSTVYYALNDWLGTKRSEATAAGTLVADYQSLPFGDGYIASGGPDATDNHFTGQLHDAESQLDYFGARFYSGGLGRFISPDWSDDPEPVPYADLSNPQSLNLYSLGFNNPLTNTDADGHDCDQSTTVVTTTIFGVADGSRVTDNQRAPCNPTGIVTDAVSNVANNASQAIQNAAHQMWNYLNAPRDKGCLLKSAAKGAAYGAGTGAVLGGLGGAGVGLATTAGGASIPLALGGAAEGASVGGQLGLSVGTGIGFFSCATGSGGGGGGATKETPKSNPEKFKPVRGTSAKVNTETGEVFVKDKSGHGGDHYEVYRNIRDFENGNRAYQVWADDGSVGRSY